jgi:hypothetical protein
LSATTHYPIAIPTFPPWTPAFPLIEMGVLVLVV